MTPKFSIGERVKYVDDLPDRGGIVTKIIDVQYYKGIGVNYETGIVWPVDSIVYRTCAGGQNWDLEHWLRPIPKPQYDTKGKWKDSPWTPKRVTV
jgi:hypothetical protein